MHMKKFIYQIIINIAFKGKEIILGPLDLGLWMKKILYKILLNQIQHCSKVNISETNLIHD
jgi:hypothetical protein